MKISLTGTRGIPNHYGGFEQFAEQLSTWLAGRGYDVWVYNPTHHPFPGNMFQGVNILHIPYPERILGPTAFFLYDYLCLKDAIKRSTDIILECGYASAAPSYRFLNFKNSKIITHLDGLEWNRPKWSPLTQKIMKRTEKTAVRFSHALVCDHPEIQSYVEHTYHVKPRYIPYGAEIFKDPDRRIIERFNVSTDEYYLVIARLEPENNLQTIIKGFLKTGHEEKLLIVGDHNNAFGRRLFNDYGALENIIFLNALYDQNILNNLRHFSKAYFHGHSVGGTNPSLLEAMAAGSLIISHDNQFNRLILKDNALYFNNEEDIQSILSSLQDLSDQKEKMIHANIKIIQDNYQWEKVTDQYEDLFSNILRK